MEGGRQEQQLAIISPEDRWEKRDKEIRWLCLRFYSAICMAIKFKTERRTRIVDFPRSLAFTSQDETAILKHTLWLAGAVCKLYSTPQIVKVMSSSQSIAKTNSTPPAKKPKTAPASNAAASDGDQKTASAAVDPALLARVMEEAGKQFVTKEEFKEEVRKQYVTKEEHAALKERLDHFITDAFGPATQHALFETAIYEFVDQKIPTDLKKDHEGKIKHGIVALCLDVMEILLSNATKKLTWHGPSTRKGFQKNRNFLWCWEDSLG